MPAPRDIRKEVRLTDEESRLFQTAADADGESLSVWLRRAGRAQLLRDEGRRLGVLPPKRRAK